MNEKLRPRKGSPRQSQQEDKPIDMNTSDENLHRDLPVQGNEEAPVRSFRPRRTEPNARPRTEEPDSQVSRSRYDEIQPSYNASRQDFEQRQAKPYRRFDTQAPRGGSPYTPRPRSTGYDPAAQRGYNPYGRPPYQERPYGRQENTGYSPRAGREPGQHSYQGFKKSGKHSNDPLPKKVKERSETIIKALGQLHYASRNICLEAIRDGLVKINGITVTKQNAPYYPSRDVVTVNNITLKAADPSLYIAFNKPSKTSGSAETGEASIYSVLESKKGWYFPAGCLNRAACGIVIVTNDDAHKTQDNSPIAGSLKEYHIKIHCKPKPKEIELLKTHLLKLGVAGISVQDVTLLKTTARHSWLSIIMSKGNLTELRKAVKSAGFEILAFVRYRVGGFTVDELPEGSWKRLTEDEVNLLTSTADVVIPEVNESEDDTKPKWQQLYQQWFKST